MTMCPQHGYRRQHTVITVSHGLMHILIVLAWGLPLVSSQSIAPPLTPTSQTATIAGSATIRYTCPTRTLEPYPVPSIGVCGRPCFPDGDPYPQVGCSTGDNCCFCHQERLSFLLECCLYDRCGDATTNAYTQWLNSACYNLGYPPTGFQGMNCTKPASSSSPNSLSAGASAGIGVGVSIAILALLALFAFLLLRRRRKHRRAEQERQFPVSQTERQAQSLYSRYGGAIQHSRATELAGPDVPAQYDVKALAAQGQIVSHTNTGTGTETPTARYSGFEPSIASPASRTGSTHGSEMRQSTPIQSLHARDTGTMGAETGAGTVTAQTTGTGTLGSSGPPQLGRLQFTSPDDVGLAIGEPSMRQEMFELPADVRQGEVGAVGSDGVWRSWSRRAGR